jgi:hypothetical protein
LNSASPPGDKAEFKNVKVWAFLEIKSLFSERTPPFQKIYVFLGGGTILLSTTLVHYTSS